MKSLIVYYSFTGNTEKIASTLSGVLKDKGNAVTTRLTPLNETRGFFIQCIQAALGMRAKLAKEIDSDISEFDLLCLGTPVWAFAPTPAMNTYIDNLKGAQGKTALIFTTFGSGTGVRKCVNAIKKRLKEKGVSSIKEFNIQMLKVSDEGYVRKRIEDAGI